VVIAHLVIVACGTTRRDATLVGPSPEAVVVASFNFPESRLLAEIYAIALEQHGLEVVRELDLGPRELVNPALRQGLVDIVPEYVGTALEYVDSDAVLAASDTTAAHDVLFRELGRFGLSVLEPSPAQDQNAVAVTRGTAERLGLRTVSDLARLGGAFALTGPPECVHRRYCLPGLAEVYGIHPDRFVPYATVAQRVSALDQGIAEVAVVFTTDGHTAIGDYVVLEDDRGLQPAENIVPVLSARADARWGTIIRPTLDGVSAKLTSPALTFLNWRIVVAGRDPATEARAWLVRQGLVPRG
jgi:osmoprotectant transport system substrate-binding protein